MKSFVLFSPSLKKKKKWNDKVIFFFITFYYVCWQNVSPPPKKRFEGYFNETLYICLIGCIIMPNMPNICTCIFRKFLQSWVYYEVPFENTVFSYMFRLNEEGWIVSLVRMNWSWIWLARSRIVLTSLPLPYAFGLVPNTMHILKNNHAQYVYVIGINQAAGVIQKTL